MANCENCANSKQCDRYEPKSTIACIGYKPNRCIDPIIKFCQECQYGWVHFPDWVENQDDLSNCNIEMGCTLGFDKGRPEDEPTKEELDEFNKMYQR